MRRRHPYNNNRFEYIKARLVIGAIIAAIVFLFLLITGKLF